MKEPKHGLAILIANKSPKGEEGEEDDGAALDSMKAFLSAVSDDDPEAALEEFKNLIDLTS